MTLTKNKTNWVINFLPIVLLFLAGTFYLYYFTSYIFFYQEKSSLFLVSFDFLLNHLNQPGGFLIYLGDLQTTFYYYPLVGAILVSLEVLATVFLVGRIGKKISGKRSFFVPFLIGAGLFYLQTNYQYVALNNLGIIIQLCLFLWVISYSNRRYEWIPVLLFPVNYFLFGSFSILFLVQYSIHLIQNKDWPKIVVLWLAGVAFYFVGKEFLFFQTTESLFKSPFSFQNIGGQIAVFTILAALVVFLPLLLRLETKRLNSVSVFKVKLPELTPYVIIIILAILVIPRIDKRNSHYFHVEKLFYEQKYDEIIQFNLQFPSSNMLTIFLNNVSLAETGRLTDSFFHFRQSPDGGTLFLKWEIVNEVLKRGGYFYYAIGMVNEAQRWAYEYMVMQGNSPEALKMMIKTDLIKGKYEIAEKYISILEKSVFYGTQAKEFRNLLFNDEAVKQHTELGAKQQLDTRQDFFVQSDNPSNNLDLIINADSSNIPAIEYKLAWLMLQKDMKGIVEMLPVMEQAGYSRIPKNVEEAVVTYKLLKVGEMPELSRLRVNPQTGERFQVYYRTFQQNQGNKQLAQRALARDFSDTYWYYVFFN